MFEIRLETQLSFSNQSLYLYFWIVTFLPTMITFLPTMITFLPTISSGISNQFIFTFLNKQLLVLNYQDVGIDI